MIFSVIQLGWDHWIFLIKIALNTLGCLLARQYAELYLSSVLGKTRKTYCLLVRVKGHLDKRTLAIIYGSMFAPNVFFVVLFLKFLSKSDKKRIRMYSFRFCKYFLGIPLWFKNRYIIRKFRIFDFTVKIGQQYDWFHRRSSEIRVNFRLNCLV